jgi:hypothetical protein
MGPSPDREGEVLSPQRATASQRCLGTPRTHLLLVSVSSSVWDNILARKNVATSGFFFFFFFFFRKSELMPGKESFSFLSGNLSSLR